MTLYKQGKTTYTRLIQQLIQLRQLRQLIQVGKDNSADLNILKKKKNPGKAGKSYDEGIIGR